MSEQTNSIKSLEFCKIAVSNIDSLILTCDTCTCDTCGCLTLDQGIRSHGVDTS